MKRLVQVRMYFVGHIIPHFLEVNNELLPFQMDWLTSNNYGGVFALDVSQDDFANYCGFGPSPLLMTIKVWSRV